MNVLAMDCATAACSAAIRRDDDLVARRFEEMARGHSESLMIMVREVMAEAGLDFPALDLIAVTVGPGAFTGVRIGLAAARALSIATGLPLVGVTTLEAVARAQGRQTEAMLVALETKRRDIYIQLFDPGRGPNGDPDSVLPEDLAGALPVIPPLVAGDAAARAAAALVDAGVRTRALDGSPHPDAAIVAEVAADCYSETATLPPPEPLYLRPPDVGPPKARPK